MTTALYNPTQKELDKAKYDELYNASKLLQNENYILKAKLEKFRLENDWLYEIIEVARQCWNKYGTEKAIINLVLAVKEKKWK